MSRKRVRGTPLYIVLCASLSLMVLAGCSGPIRAKDKGDTSRSEAENIELRFAWWGSKADTTGL